MRQLKFRAWNPRLKQMEYFDDLYWFEDNYVHHDGDNDYEISQFTGIADCDGREIYEGDLVYFKVIYFNHEAHEYINQEVKYKSNLGMYVFGEDEYCMADRILRIRVTGNKWENRDGQ